MWGFRTPKNHFPTRAESALTCRMKRSRKRPARWPAYKRIPQFTPVPVRNRRDGWTPIRQARFIAALAETGCVARAARRAGMARETAYRLRRKTGAESFVHAWDAILALRSGVTPTPRKVTPQELWICAVDGPISFRLWRGRVRSIIRQPSDSALLRVLTSRHAGSGPLPAGWR